MKTKNYAEKIRRRKQSFKQIGVKPNLIPTKERKYWIWFLVFVAIIIFLNVAYENQLPKGWWSNYENLMLPVAIFSVILLVMILWIMPKAYVRSLRNKSLNINQSEFDREKEKLKLEDDTRKTIAQIIGGAVFLLGLIFTFNTYRLNVEKQTLDREGQITDRFTKAVSQLGDKDIAVRLGGLYALERVAKDSPKDHWTIVEIISAYVRKKSPKYGVSKTSEEANGKEQNRSNQNNKLGNDTIQTDIQVALTIIGRRIRKQDPSNNRIDLSEANLKDANLSGAYFNRADLNGAYLNGANLSGAYLGFINFSGANLSEAFLNRAYLSSTQLSEADLSEADLSEANLDNTDLSNASFFNANLRGASFLEANFSDANLDGADLSGTDLRNTRNLTYEQMKTVIINDETKLPEELESHQQEFLDISKKILEEKASNE